MVRPMKRKVKSCPTGSGFEGKRIINNTSNMAKEEKEQIRSRDKTLDSRTLSMMTTCSAGSLDTTMQQHSYERRKVRNDALMTRKKGQKQPPSIRKGLVNIDANLIHKRRSSDGSDGTFSSNTNTHSVPLAPDHKNKHSSKSRVEKRQGQGQGILKKSSSRNHINFVHSDDDNNKQWLIPKWMKLSTSSTSDNKQHINISNKNNVHDHEPIANIIKSRNMTKVRFDLTKNVIYDDYNSSVSIHRNNKSLYSATNLSQVQGFMNRVLFGTNHNSANDLDEHNDDPQLIFKSNGTQSSLQSHQTSNTANNQFQEDSIVTANIKDLILKGRKAQYITFQYHKASKYLLQAISKLDEYNYPDCHKLRITTLGLLNDTHHSMRSLEHSSDIVKIGLKHEEKGDYIKALKMYTVAFRMRRDVMGKKHPSLPVLLNMLGSVQVKRGEFSEAMQIFELALYGRLKDDNMKIVGKTYVNEGTRAVSMREMGKIHEMRGEDNDALEMYHSSLECVIERKNYNVEIDENNGDCVQSDNEKSHSDNEQTILHDDVRLINAADDNVESLTSKTSTKIQSEEMEVYLENKRYLGQRDASNLCAFYNIFFQNSKLIKNKNISVHVSMTLHHIANVHGKRGHHELALNSYKAALRGMKIALGHNHPNVAAVLGNIGNLYKEMKKYDDAFEIYQDVYRIESKNLDVGHPEIVVTMHNIALIEKCRGNYSNSKRLYREVLSIQLGRKERTIKWYNATAVSYSNLGDVEERDGNYKAAIKAYKEALYTRTQYVDKFHPDLGRLLHKIGVLSSIHGNFGDAAIYFAKALRVYEFNKIEDSRVTAVLRDQADVLGKIAFSTMTI